MKVTKAKDESKTLDKSFNALSWLLRFMGLLVWCFVYVTFVWFFDDRDGLEKFMGFSALGLGILSILLPKNLFGERSWFSMIYTFFGLSVLFLMLINL